MSSSPTAACARPLIVEVDHGTYYSETSDISSDITSDGGGGGGGGDDDDEEETDASSPLESESFEEYISPSLSCVARKQQSRRHEHEF
jgi:hypothetical protein